MFVKKNHGSIVVLVKFTRIVSKADYSNNVSGTRVASKLKSSAETNSFYELFGAPVSGWHLAAGFPKRPKKRVRRQVAVRGSTPVVTATPVATLSVPVSQKESPTVVISPTSSLALVSTTVTAPSKSSLEETVPSATIVKSLPVVPVFTTDIPYVKSPSAVMSSTVVVAPLPTVVSSVVSAPAKATTQETKMYAETTVAAKPSPDKFTVPAVTSPTSAAVPIQPTSVIQPPETSSTVVLPVRPLISSSPVLTDTTTAAEEVATSAMLLPATTPAMAAEMTTQEKRLQMTSELIRTTTVATPATLVAATQSLLATSILMPPTTPKQPVVSTEETPTTTTTKPPVWLNFSPKLKKKINRIPLVFGEYLLYRIPEDTFYDKEDGNTRNLRLQLQTSKGKPVSADSWIQLREDKQEIYGLPMDVSFRLYNYKLVATDSGNKSITDEFEVTVHKDSSEYNHQFTIQMLLDHFNFMKNTSLHTLLLEKMAGYFGVNVTNIRVVGFASGSVVFTFSFDFVQYEPCNHNEILELISKFRDSNGAVSQDLRRSLLPEFPIESGSLSLSGSCADVFDGGKNKNKDAEADRAWWIYAIIPAVALVALIIITCIVVIRHKRKNKTFIMQERSDYFHLYQKTPTVMQDEYELKEQSPLV